MTNLATRLAPSPTGALHLGNARTFLITWAIARQRGWRVIMRIEDLDGPRIKSDAAQNVLDILTWLGIDWDGDVLTQSDDLSPYRDAMRRLADAGKVFACELTRAQIEQAATAPHVDDHELRFPPKLRPPPPYGIFERPDTNYRFLVNDRQIEVSDNILGKSLHNPAREIGDFVVWTKRAAPSYQLAVVVDDARQGVTDVIRGADLLPSAARQTLLYEAFRLQPPRWWHLPLVIGPDGRRLAKRHGDTRIDAYRQAGVQAQRIIGLLAWWSGASAIRCEMTAAEFCDLFDVQSLPHSPVCFTESDHAWLLGM